jgi:hypothetical protein
LAQQQDMAAAFQSLVKTSWKVVWASEVTLGTLPVSQYWQVEMVVREWLQMQKPNF